MIKQKVDIIELDDDAKIQNAPYKYKTLLWTSNDGGKLYWHCGAGKYFETLEAAQEYKQVIEK